MKYYLTLCDGFFLGLGVVNWMFIVGVCMKLKWLRWSGAWIDVFLKFSCLLWLNKLLMCVKFILWFGMLNEDDCWALYIANFVYFFSFAVCTNCCLELELYSSWIDVCVYFSVCSVCDLEIGWILFCVVTLFPCLSHDYIKV